jgi:hypothetical protein
MISSKKRSREIIFLFWFGMILVFVSAQIRAHEDPWKGLSVIRVSGYSPPDFTLPTLDGGSITLKLLDHMVPPMQRRNAIVREALQTLQT